MTKWAFMTDPATGNVGLFDEAAPGAVPSDYTDPDSATNAPLNDPENWLENVYWHVLLDNMEVLFDTTVTVNHAATSAGTTSSTGGTTTSGASAAYDVDTSTTDWDVYTHSAGYAPVVFAAIGSNILVPGYPVQVPATANAASRFVTLYTTTTKVFLREFRTRGTAGLPALSQDYRLIGFRPQRSVEGNDPPRLIDFDPATGLLSMGDGRFRNDRRYLQVVPGGSPFGLPYGRTLDLKNGGYRLARSDGTTVDPLPNTIQQRVLAGGGEFSTDTGSSYGPPMYYDGTWAPSEILEVQAP